MKKDRIILCVSIVLGIICSILVVTASPLYEAMSKGEPTEAEYEHMKEYAIMYTKTLNQDFVEENDINITSEVYDGKFLVTVTQTNRGSVNAVYPMKINSDNSNTVLTEIAVDKGIYEEIYDRSNQITMLIPATMISIFIASAAEFYKIKFIVWVILKIKSKIKKEKKH